MPKTVKKEVAVSSPQPIVEETKTVNPIVPETKIVSAEEALLTPQQKAARIVNKFTMLSQEGQKMFTKEDEIYAEMSLKDEPVKFGTTSWPSIGTFLGGRDPHKYFKNGLCHSSIVKYFGDLLPEDREEVMLLRKIIKDTDLLMYKHQRFNQYTILVPKIYSEFDLTAENEYDGRKVYQDYYTVAFTGQMGVPGAFEEKFFETKVRQMLAKLKVAGEKRNTRIE